MEEITPKTLRLPQKEANGENQKIELPKNLVLVGANGSGKTRMSLWIEWHNREIFIHRVSAQKSLNMPASISPIDEEVSNHMFLYGNSYKDITYLKRNGKKNYRWGGNPATHLLNDFEQLLTELFTENYRKTIEFRTKRKGNDSTFDNETNLEILKNIWESVIKHRTLNIEVGKITVTSEDNSTYNASEMSDGERAIFYFIGEVLCVPENAVIIIDEPENHLHHAILTNLWNAIENARPDCTFLYITHNLDFALSRKNASLLWVQTMVDESTWQYEILDEEHEDLFSALGLEMLGSRQKILLVEGRQEKSYDAKLYQTIFPEYNVIPVDNCNLVAQFTKAYRKLAHLHNNEVKGLIDRDRRSEEELEKLRSKGIYAPLVAEIENLFMIEEVITVIAQDRHKEQPEIDRILAETKEKTFQFLATELTNQAILFLAQERQNLVNNILNTKIKTLEESKAQLTQVSQINLDTPYQKIINDLKEIIEQKDFEKALKIINHKGLLEKSCLTPHFGWRQDYYIEEVLRLTQTNTEAGQTLQKCFRNYIPLD